MEGQKSVTVTNITAMEAESQLAEMDKVIQKKFEGAQMLGVHYHEYWACINGEYNESRAYIYQDDISLVKHFEKELSEGFSFKIHEGDDYVEVLASAEPSHSVNDWKMVKVAEV